MGVSSLPVYKQKQKIIDAVAENQVIVVESPTGSGKTTQLPIILYEAGYGKDKMIGVTQPRRIAAVSVSDFIADQLDTQVSGTVGYTIRFEDLTGKDTKIKIMTDGILLQELKTDRLLSRYQVIIVDEAHERSLNIDFILGLLKIILLERPDFKVIISSATLNTRVFSEYFGRCPVVYIDSKMFPVEIHYTPPEIEGNEDALLNRISGLVSSIKKEKKSGDILIFLSGEKQIKDCISLISLLPFRKELLLLPLYGRLSKEDQERVFIPTPKGKTKIIVATNIAETSVTIDGVTAIIDSGFAKMNFYNPKTFTSSLVQTPISKASCDQRKGRAGRTRPGDCYRLYSKQEYGSRPLYTLEEIYRTDLAEVVLRMADLEIDDFESFDFISPPGRQGIHSAVETLKLLEALNDHNKLTSIGKSMVVFPLLPRHSRILMESINRYPDVLEETIIAATFLSTNSPFLLPIGEEMSARKAHHTFNDKAGDFVSYLHLYRKYIQAKDKQDFCATYYLDERSMGEIANIKEQLEEIVSGMGIPILSGGEVSSYLCAIARGLIQYVCVRDKRYSYRSLTAERIMIHPGSVMFKETPMYIVAGEIVRTSKLFARSVSPLEKSWLSRISPLLISNLPAYDNRRDSGKKQKENRDTSWRMNLGKYSFKLQPYKGKKKIAILPWEQLRPLLNNGDLAENLAGKNLRGTVLYNHAELMWGEKLSSIVSVLSTISPDTDLVHKWPRSVNYSLPEDTSLICSNIQFILKLCTLKKKRAQLGFISLASDGQSRYWFKGTRSYSAAVSESLMSLEILADEISSGTEPASLDGINRLYRKLAGIYESL